MKKERDLHVKILLSIADRVRGGTPWSISVHPGVSEDDYHSVVFVPNVFDGFVVRVEGEKIVLVSENDVSFRRVEFDVDQPNVFESVLDTLWPLLYDRDRAVGTVE